MVGKAAAAALHGVSSRCGADAFASAPARHPHPQFGAARVRLQPFAVGELGDLAQRLRAFGADFDQARALLKSYTPSGDEKRAVREVGSTWFGPAQ
jgi:hypothetical protein